VVAVGGLPPFYGNRTGLEVPLDHTYVIFDGDNDIWAYGYMKGWKALRNIDFDFRDAHDVHGLTRRATDEAYVKRQLAPVLRNAGQVIVLAGDSTRHLYKFVRWEIDLAIAHDRPIIVANLNKLRTHDPNRCPPLLDDVYAVHVSFERAIIRCALDHFPKEYRNRGVEKGPRYYTENVYRGLGL
jgi:hypothetical protein